MNLRGKAPSSIEAENLIEVTVLFTNSLHIAKGLDFLFSIL
jgi:hypothetical protein